MRILHILDHSIPLHSGYTFRTRSILREQHRLGWETYQLTSAKHLGATADREEVDGLIFYRSPPLGSTLAKLPVINQLAVIQGLRKRLREVVKEVRPDILHAHSPALNGAAALAVARELGIPLVYEVRAFWEDAAVDHGTSREGDLRYRISRALETHVLHRASAVTTICEGLRGEIVARGIDTQRVTVIPNAVDLDAFGMAGKADPALRESLGLGEGPVLGFIGSFYAYEGLSLLVEALPRILAKHPGARLLLVGGGPQDQLLRQAVESRRLGEQVVFTGRVPHAEVGRYYDLVDVLVYPRLPMRLTELVTPLKPLEAMAQGRLVVASDVGGHRELIQDRETGMLFPAGQAEALADAVCALLADPALAPRLRENGRRFVQESRNWRVSVGNYQKVYGSLLAGAPGVAA